jgi:serine phosphatase RsbU (regulator of sigma subunit)
MKFSPANRDKFAELTRTLKEDLERLKAGEPPVLPGFDMAAVNQQAGEVGGDFYDFAPRAGLRVGVIIADVCGKGTSAAQIAAQSRPILRELLATERAPAALFAEALPRIVLNLPKGRFVTALCVVLDSVSRSFRFARAGHDPLLWYHAANQTVETLSPKGMALGIEREGLLEATFTEKEYQLAPGDILLLHTDGITESFAPTGDEFGCDRLRNILVDSAPLEARAIAAKILATVDAFTQGAPQPDDRTLVVIKAL